MYLNFVTRPIQSYNDVFILRLFSVPFVFKACRESYNMPVWCWSHFGGSILLREGFFKSKKQLKNTQAEI